MNQTITIKYTEFEVIERNTPEVYEEKGMGNLANHMRKQRITAWLIVKRLKGKVLYQVAEFKSGTYSELMN